MKKKIGVIGLGNPLRRDDGIGILLLNRIQTKKNTIKGNISFIDGGTSGMNLLHLLASFESVLIIDAVDFKAKPGEFRLFSIEEIQDQNIQISLSTHESDFLQVVRLSKELNELPSTLRIFGIQPADVSYGTGVSKEMESVLEKLTQEVCNQITLLIK